MQTMRFAELSQSSYLLQNLADIVKTAYEEEDTGVLLLQDAQKTKTLSMMTSINISKYTQHTPQASKSWNSFG